MFNEVQRTNAITENAIQELETAIREKNLEKTKQLLKKMDINKTKVLGTTATPLHMAVIHKTSQEILDFLIQLFKKKQISLDIIDGSNRTALDGAFIDGNLPAIRLLIKAGADFQRWMPNQELNMTYLEFFRKTHKNQSEKILEIDNTIQASRKNELSEAIPEVSITSTSYLSKAINYLYKGYQKINTSEPEEMKLTHTKSPKLGSSQKQKKE